MRPSSESYSNTFFLLEHCLSFTQHGQASANFGFLVVSLFVEAINLVLSLFTAKPIFAYSFSALANAAVKSRHVRPMISISSANASSMWLFMKIMTFLFTAVSRTTFFNKILNGSHDRLSIQLKSSIAKRKSSAYEKSDHPGTKKGLYCWFHNQGKTLCQKM